MIILRLFFEFFKVGLFAVGGGMATIPFLYDLADRTAWYTHAQLADMIAVSESTPGPIGVNMATYVGYTCGGPLGALSATVGLVLPSLIIVLLIARVLQRFRRNRFVEGAFYGLRAASTGLIAAAGVAVMKIALLNLDLFRESGILADLFSWRSLLLALAVLILTNFVPRVKDWHPIVFIALSAAAGVVFRLAGA
ncbi:MAG: chromate transporter [Oscillibacter sp.]|nr:chromate transporter [Oscillibacter sp.]